MCESEADERSKCHARGGSEARSAARLAIESARNLLGRKRRSLSRRRGENAAVGANGRRMASSLVAPEALPGGRLSLAAMIAAAMTVISVETWERLAAASWV